MVRSVGGSVVEGDEEDARHGRTVPSGRSRRGPCRALRPLPGRAGDGGAGGRSRNHHGADGGAPRSADGRLPAPFAFAGAVLGAARRLTVTVSATIGRLYDPLRPAEEIAVLDLLSGGRLVTVAGIGYRPEEYERAGVPCAERGRLQVELLDTLLRASTGEEVTYRGCAVRVTPRPYSKPHPPLPVGGSSRAAARRAVPAAVLPQRASAGARALLQGAARGVRHQRLDEDAVRRDVAAASLRRTPSRPGRATAGTFARGADLRLLAAVRGSFGGAAGRGDGAGAARGGGCTGSSHPRSAWRWSAGPVCCIPPAGGMPVDEGWRSLRLFAERALPRTDG